MANFFQVHLFHLCIMMAERGHCIGNLFRVPVRKTPPSVIRRATPFEFFQPQPSKVKDLNDFIGVNQVSENRIA